MTKREEVTIRRDAECILFNLGLSTNEVAQALGIDHGVIVNDYKYLRESDRVPQRHRGRPMSQSDVYTNAVVKYSQWVYMFWDEDSEIKQYPEVFHLVISALENYFDLKHICAVLDGVAALITLLRNPLDDPPEYRNYRAFVNEVFFGKKKFSGEKILDSYFKALCRGEINAPDRNALESICVRYALEEYHWSFARALDKTVIPVVNDIMSTISPRLEVFLRMYSGIGHSNLTSKQITERYGVGRERVRQIVEKAQRGMRHPYQARILKALFFTAEESVVEALKDRQFPVYTLSHVSKALSKYLNTQVENLGLSVSTYCYHKNGELVIVYQIGYTKGNGTELE